MDLDSVVVGYCSAAVVACVFLEVLAEISPSASNADHDSFSMLSDKTDEELDRCFASRAG